MRGKSVIHKKLQYGKYEDQATPLSTLCGIRAGEEGF
jgi:hypothetical protein